MFLTCIFPSGPKFTVYKSDSSGPFVVEELVVEVGVVVVVVVFDVWIVELAFVVVVVSTVGVVEVV
jgi:hypothetical protein